MINHCSLFCLSLSSVETMTHFFALWTRCKVYTINKSSGKNSLNNFWNDVRKLCQNRICLLPWEIFQIHCPLPTISVTMYLSSFVIMSHWLSHLCIWQLLFSRAIFYFKRNWFTCQPRAEIINHLSLLISSWNAITFPFPWLLKCFEFQLAKLNFKKNSSEKVIPTLIHHCFFNDTLYYYCKNGI